MSSESHYQDPLVSAHNRTKRYLAAAAAGKTTARFGCSDFYPPPSPPSPTALLQDEYEYDNDEEYTDDGDREETGSDCRKRRTSRGSKTPASSTNTSKYTKKVSPASSEFDKEDDRSDEEEPGSDNNSDFGGDDSDGELEFQDNLEQIIKRLEKRQGDGKFQNTNLSIIQSLTRQYPQHKEAIKSTMSALSKSKAANKKLASQVKNLQEQLDAVNDELSEANNCYEQECKDHEQTKDKLEALQKKYKAALEKAKAKGLSIHIQFALDSGTDPMIP